MHYKRVMERHAHLVGLFALLLISLGTAATDEEVEDEDIEFFGGKDQYYDPDDMLHFNQREVERAHETGSLKDNIRKFKSRTRDTVTKIGKKIGKKIKDTVLACEYEEYKKNITYLQKLSDDCRREKKMLLKKMTLLEGNSKKDDKHTPVLMPFIRRYVLFLQEQFAEKSAPPANSEYAVRMSVSEESRAALSRFSTSDSGGDMDEGEGGKGNVQDVFFALEAMMVQVELLTPDQLQVEAASNSRLNWIKEKLTLHNILMVIAVGSLLRLALSLPLRLSWLSVTWRSLVAMFLISIPWNWWHLYMVAVSRRNRELLKEIPSDCIQDEGEAGLWNTIMSAFRFKKDHCLEYHVQLAVDPLWEVTPFMALAVTITKTVTEPMELVSKGMSRFIRGALEDMPFHLQIPVFILCVAMLLLVLIMLFGYNVRLFHFFRIEEAPRQPGGGMIRQLAEQERDRQIADRDAQIQALEGRIEALQGEKQAIEGEKEELEGENRDLQNKLLRLVQRPCATPAIAAAATETPTIPAPAPTLAATPLLVAASTQPSQAVGVEDVKPRKPRSEDAAGATAIGLQNQDRGPPVATVGPQPRTPEQPNDDDGEETKRLYLHPVSASSSATRVSGVRVPLVAPAQYRRQHTAPAAFDDDDDDNVDLYGASPSVQPRHSTALTDLTATGATAPHIEHRRSETDLLNRRGHPMTTTTPENFGLQHRGRDQLTHSASVGGILVETMIDSTDGHSERNVSEGGHQLLFGHEPVGTMTDSTDRFSEHIVSEGGRQLSSPSLVIQSESTKQALPGETTYSSSESSLSHPPEPASFSTIPFTAAINRPLLPTVALATGTQVNDTISLSGSWVGVRRDDVEEGQGDARPITPLEDSEDGIEVLEDEHSN